MGKDHGPSFKFVHEVEGRRYKNLAGSTDEPSVDGTTPQNEGDFHSDFSTHTTQSCFRAYQLVNHDDFKDDQLLVLFLTVPVRSIPKNQISSVNFDKVFITGILYRNLIGGELFRKI